MPTSFRLRLECNGPAPSQDAGPTSSRCVATALARSSALSKIVARRENTTLNLTN